MRRSVWVAMSVLGLLAIAGATVSVWLAEFRRPNLRVGMTGKEPRCAVADQVEPVGGPRFRAEGDKDLDGEWERRSCVEDGKEWSPPAEVRYLLAFKGGALQFLMAAKEGDEHEVVAEWVVKTNTTVVPKAIDIAPSEDAREGVAEPCIYEVDGDELRICRPQFDKPRPTEFSGKEGSGLRLETYHRAKQ